MTLYTQISANKKRTAFYLGLFLIVVTALGWLFSYVYDSPMILYIAVAFSLIQALVSYYSGDSIALAVSGARPIEKKDNPELWRLVENLTITSGLPMPRVFMIDDLAPNAFATGRDPKHASIAVTSGLLDRLDKKETEAVIAHELSHIGNYDIRLMTVVVVLVGVISLLSSIFLRSQIFGFGRRSDRNEGGQLGLIIFVISIIGAILAPVAATLIQLAISRKREFLADSSGALLTRYPEGLANALEKISGYRQPMFRANSATAHLYISNPLGAKESYLSKIFSTHPPIEERIRILRQMDISQ